MSSKKRFPITQKVSLDLFGETVSDADAVYDLFVDKYHEYILGRISYIVRTISPETMRVSCPGLEIYGIPVESVEKQGDRIVLNSQDPSSQDYVDDFSDDGDVLFQICNFLEEIYVSPDARFCPYEPLSDEYGDFDDFDDIEDDIPVTVLEMVEDINDRVQTGTTEDVIGEILDSAALLLAKCDDPEEAIKDFSKRVRDFVREETADDDKVPLSVPLCFGDKKILS